MGSQYSSGDLLEFLSQKGSELSPLLILTHDHPDPDTMASAWALSTLVERLYQVRSIMAYGGMIGRMENKMMVKTLRIPINPLKADQLERYQSIALVDTQPPFENNRFSLRRKPTLVIDHHPPHTKTKADFLMIDESVGATTTLLAEAFLSAGLDISTPMATAMAYGIGSETQDLRREASPRDVHIYRMLLPKINMRILSQIEDPPRPKSFFFTLSKAIRHAFIIRKVIGVHLGSVPSQDIVAHMADFLLTHEKVKWSLATGRYGGELFISLRTQNPTAKAGRLLWRLLGGGASGGGHGMIAGGAITVGQDANEEKWRKAEGEFTTAFLKSQGYREPFDLAYPYQGIH